MTAVRVEIDMSNSAGIFQVDELLATKLRGSGLEQHIEVIARIEAEHEKRLIPVFRIWGAGAVRAAPRAVSGRGWDRGKRRLGIGYRAGRSGSPENVTSDGVLASRVASGPAGVFSVTFSGRRASGRRPPGSWPRLLAPGPLLPASRRAGLGERRLGKGTVGEALPDE